jgi:hypothetical protein
MQRCEAWEAQTFAYREMPVIGMEVQDVEFVRPANHLIQFDDVMRQWIGTFWVQP